ncbi:MAG: MBL fold metallo-hydrolase, partial [Clostridia bacterium]|nr:MBL fold metallo-hydrolase [Clostridia bacterium]
QEVLERLNSYGVKIYRTDEEGIIVATSDGTNITFDKEASTITAGSAPFQPETENKEETVYITKTGSKYHRENCKYLKSSKIPVSLEKAKADGYEPCKVCKP